MIKYKLRKDARQFFKEDMSEKIKPIEFWNNEKIHENLLEQVDNVYIDFGIKTSEIGTSLKGWDSNFGNPRSHFHFTVNVNDISDTNYNSISVPEMMDEMQKVLNRFIVRYVESA